MTAADPTARFEPLYVSAAAGEAEVPWDLEDPTARFAQWAEATDLRGGGRRAVVVGCAFGRDAEYLAAREFDVTAFDIAPSAIAGARTRHPHSPVDYMVADLFALPTEWVGAFAFVLESTTAQALPDHVRPTAIAAIASLVASGGTLVVCAVGRADDAPHPDGPPWPLLRREVESFADGDLRTAEIDGVVDAEGLLRWRAILVRN